MTRKTDHRSIKYQLKMPAMLKSVENVKLPREINKINTNIDEIREKPENGHRDSMGTFQDA